MYCPTCGTQNGDKVKFCVGCGNQILQDEYTDSSKISEPSKIQPIQTTSSYNQTKPPVQFQSPAQVPMYYDPPVTRNATLWLLGSLIPFVYLIYIYHNFNDMKKLTRMTHPEWEPRMQDPVLMLIVFWLFSPITYYLKYQQLHEHLTRIHHEREDVPPAGGNILLYSIGGGFLTLVLFIVFLFIFFPISFLILIGYILMLAYFEYNWQESLNKHIVKHGIQTF